MNWKELSFTLFTFILTLLLYGVIYLLAIVPPANFFGLGIPEEFLSDFVLLLPGPLWSDIILLYVIPIATFLILQYIAPYSTVFYVKLHKSFYFLRMTPNYGINPISEEISISKTIFRSLKVSFLSFVVAGALMQLEFGPLFRANFSAATTIQTRLLFRAEAIFLATFFLIPLMMVIFFPLWILEDSGIIAHRTFIKKRKNPDIEGVNRIFRDFLEYFIGFSTIILYVNLVVNTFYTVTNGFTTSDPALLIPIILVFLPFLIPGLFAIPYYLYERNLVRNKKRIHQRLNKKGIKYIKVPEFDEIVSRDIQNDI